MKWKGLLLTTAIVYDGFDLGHPMNSGSGFRFNKPATMPPFTSLLQVGFELERPLPYGGSARARIKVIAMNQGPESVSVRDEFVLMSGPNIVAHGRVLTIHRLDSRHADRTSTDPT